MDHLVPWLVVVVILFGWLRQGLRALRRLSAAADPSAGTVVARARARAGLPPPPLAGTARISAAPTGAAPAAPWTIVPPRPAAPPGPAAAPRPLTPPQPAAPFQPVPVVPGRRPAAAPAGPAPGGSARAVTAALGHAPTLRTAIVVAELLAPPVALR